jgi:hypothetical protein
VEQERAHNPTTGELIDDEIPEDAAEAGVLDPDQYLEDLNDTMSGANDNTTLDEIFAEHRAVEASLFPPDRDKAQKLYELHQKRIARKKK